MKISDLSKKTGVSQRMLRYFESQGLLSPQRTEADYRAYKASDQKRILEILEWQRLGLTLKEISELLTQPSSIDRILENVFSRERASFNEKQRSLRDLRERLSGEKYPYFENRVAHAIPQLNNITDDVATAGWHIKETVYLRFCDWQDSYTLFPFVMIGELIWQSAFYLLTSQDETNEDELEKLMARFCKASQKQWPSFDGHPPKRIDVDDLGTFFGAHDIVISLMFESQSSETVHLVLPYQALFGLSK